MREYLNKEEIKQWRSSLEKITLEEFAARLGKKIEEAKIRKKFNANATMLLEWLLFQILEGKHKWRKL